MVERSFAQWFEDRHRTRTRRGVVRSTTARDETAIDLASNDYLGLSQDPAIIDAAIAATREFGAGATASRVVSGTTRPHQTLERDITKLTGHDAALVCSSGYLANLAVVTAFAGPGCLIVLDAHAHASLHDAARLSRSKVVVVDHNDVAGVADALANNPVGRALVVIESIYSVLGDSAPISQLFAVTRVMGAMLLVDEAHAIGVVGAGRGACHAFGLAGEPLVVATCTLSKALGTQGGVVLGSHAARRHVVNEGRAFIYDTGLAPAAAAGASAAVDVVLAEPHRISRLTDLRERFCDGVGIEPSDGAVQSIPVHSAEVAATVTAELARRGVLVGCFRPPSTPDGVSRLRCTVRADLTVQHVDRAIKVIREVLAEHHIDLPGGVHV